MSSKTKTKGQAKSCPTTPIRKKADSRTVEDKVDLAEIVSNSFDSPSATAPTAAKVTTVPKKDRKSLAQEEVEGSASKLIFGRSSPGSVVNVDSKVEKVYKIVKKATGSLGGNGCNGPIYGELTMHSMQKIVNILITKCNFSHKSRFIDVGSGLGKPNFHVSQDPAVRLSLGVELEEIRWQVSHTNYLWKVCVLSTFD